MKTSKGFKWYAIASGLLLLVAAGGAVATWMAVQSYENRLDYAANMLEGGAYTCEVGDE